MVQRNALLCVLVALSAFAAVFPIDAKHRGRDEFCTYKGVRTGLIHHSGVPSTQPDLCMPSSASPIELGVYECLLRGITAVKQIDCALHLHVAADGPAVPCQFFKLQGLVTESSSAKIGAMVDMDGLEGYFVSNQDLVAELSMPSSSAAAQEVYNFVVQLFGDVLPFDSDVNTSGDKVASATPHARKLAMMKPEHPVVWTVGEEDYSEEEEELLEMAAELALDEDDEEDKANLDESEEGLVEAEMLGRRRGHSKRKSPVLSSMLRRRKNKIIIVTPPGCKYKFKVDDPANDVLTPRSRKNDTRIIVVAGAVIMLTCLAVSFAIFTSFSRKYSELLSDKLELEHLKSEIKKTPSLFKRFFPSEVSEPSLLETEKLATAELQA